jgi:hypothetical protein
MKKTLVAFFTIALFACNQNEIKNTEAPNNDSATKQSSLSRTLDLKVRMKYNRAIEAVNWGMPVVNYDLMFQAAKKIGADFNQIVYWSGLPDWKNQTLTPNPDVIYLMPFFNLKDVGPVVLEIPPADDGAMVGSIMDSWQSALEDVGPAGVDKGKGGKYLMLPPGYTGKTPAGYISLPCDTYHGYGLLRSVLNSGSNADIAKAIAYAKRIELYPLSQAATPAQTKFADAMGQVFDATIPYDLRYFESLDRMVQNDVWLTRDKIMIDILKSIGIEKGKPFNPDGDTKEILITAARDARSWIDSRYDAVFLPPYYENTHWGIPIQRELAQAMPTYYADPDSYPIDARGVTYSYAFFSPKHFGAGQSYLMTTKDRDGQPFKGDNNYRLQVPPNAPVRQYWSATVYDRATHAFIRNLSRTGRSSQSPGIQKNEDGSVDIYFGPKAPEGKESNWVPTSADGEFEVLFRLYGPEKAFADKSWKLSDIEKIK